MSVRGAGLALGLLIVGGASGYALGTLRSSESTSFTDPVPIAAVSPSSPADPVDVRRDPGAPALQPGLTLRRTSVGRAPFDFALPVPEEWAKSNPTAGEWRWYPPPGLVLNTYFLRVRLIGNQHLPVESAVEARIDALRSADDVEDFHLATRTADGFVADYVSDGYRRVTMETYVAEAGSDTAFAWIALVGRQVDRPGMTDLFGRIVFGVGTG